MQGQFIHLSFFPLDQGLGRVPVITVTPLIISQEEYSVAELRCSASGSPSPRIEWTRLDGHISSDVVTRDGFLRFNSLRKSDEGSYRCFAQNNVGEADQTIQVYVRGHATPSEEVSVTPTQYTGEPGEEIHLRCSSNPRGRVSWTKSGAVELPRNAFASGEELTIRYSTADDSGRYICNIVFPSGSTRSAYADVVITARSNEQVPKISVFERKYSVVQSGDFELTCETTGTPYPTVTWSIVSTEIFSRSRFSISNLFSERSSIRNEHKTNWKCFAHSERSP